MRSDEVSLLFAGVLPSSGLFTVLEVEGIGSTVSGLGVEVGSWNSKSLVGDFCSGVGVMVGVGWGESGLFAGTVAEAGGFSLRFFLAKLQHFGEYQHLGV